ncbi:MAG: sugar ABC transporter ATP-binding protein [Defluviitaleaceae bacterium]|nr:sugar ABC transporter ATP-binding protein [Defluviitaleaceae bacterium]
MLEMRGIDKRFDAVIALNGASLKADRGEIRALLGSNGSGKSTLIKILAGVYGPNGGEILVDGKPIRILSGMDSKKHGIATAFQELSLIPQMSVVDNIMLGNEVPKAFGVVDRKQARQQVQALLDRFEIDCDLDAYVQTLMISTKTMLEVAKAVAQKPRILLLDEVTAALHYDEIQILFKIIQELRDEGVTIIYVTHRMNEIFEICDQVTIMRGGKNVKEGSVNELTLDDIVFHMTGQRPDLQSSGGQGMSEARDGGEILLDVQGHAVYPTVWDISMKVYRGEIIGIAGLQGQGQPEFIRSLLGAEEISGGTVTFCRKEMKFKSPTEAIRNGIGFVSGDRSREAIFPVRTICENISAGQIARGNIATYLTSKSLKDFSKEAVKTYNIKIGSLNNPASSLSGGNQQKLVIARWIALNPKLLLLDDPTKGVDIHSRHEIHKILHECVAKGMTVIISSSEYEELFDVADRIYVFYEGRVSDMLDGERMTEEFLVAAMMGMTSRQPNEAEGEKQHGTV